jgi:hypothetical protein
MSWWWKHSIMGELLGSGQWGDFTIFFLATHYRAPSSAERTHCSSAKTGASSCLPLSSLALYYCFKRRQSPPRLIIRPGDSRASSFRGRHEPLHTTLSAVAFVCFSRKRSTNFRIWRITERKYVFQSSETQRNNA